MGHRANKLKPDQQTAAWTHLAYQLEQLGDLDIPKFADLMHAIRAAQIVGYRSGK